jgi:CRP-like cAMP-binding protein
MDPRRIEEVCLKCKDNCCARCFDAGEESIFNCLTDEEMELLVKEKRHIHFNAGETILKQNTSASHIVCIKNGLAKIISEGDGDKKLILRLVVTHSILTGGGIFVDEIRHFTVQAVTEVDCCFIDTEKIYELVSKNSQFAFELLRVADLLLYLKNEIFLSNPFNTRLSRKELADMCGMTMESFIRILKEFKSSEILTVDGTTIHVVDEEALQLISKKG